MYKTANIFLFLALIFWFPGFSNASINPWEPVTDPIKIFNEGYIKVIASSEKNQSYFKAIRAATILAQRDLLEILQGLQLSGTTSIKDGMLDDDSINIAIKGHLKGTVKCGARYDRNLGFAEVCLKVFIKGKGELYDTILPLIKEKKLISLQEPAYAPRITPGKNISEDTEMPTANFERASPSDKPLKSDTSNPYDGLIIDLRGMDFRPALINRILTRRNEVVYDASKIISSVLVERGTGGFTNDEKKARALLQTWGTKNPLFIKAEDVLKFTDARISPGDAASIFTHDQQSNFLAQAKVVFLLE